MTLGTIAIVVVFAVIIFFAVRSSRKHMKGEGGCCGGGGGTIADPPKELENPAIGKKIVHIEGMHCDNCKNSVERSVNHLEGAACRVDLKNNLAEVTYDRPIEDNALRFAIERLDFTVTGIETEEA